MGDYLVIAVIVLLVIACISIAIYASDTFLEQAKSFEILPATQTYFISATILTIIIVIVVIFHLMRRTDL